jgi:hypothetical protein
MKNLRTKNGLQVNQIGETKDLILGLVAGQKSFLAWNKTDGKQHNNNRRSKFDLMFEEPVSKERFVVVKKWGNRLSANILEKEPKQTKSVLKCIKITI